jgi:hypothetical protein
VDGVIHHVARIRVPATPECRGATLQMYTGLYNRTTGRRVATVNPHIPDDRIHAASFTIAAANSALPAPTPVKPSDMAGAELWSRLSPWLGWLAGVFVAALLTWLLTRKKAGPHPHVVDLRDVDAGPLPPVLGRKTRTAVVALLLAVPLVLTFLAALDFIKDDAYISFRYAHNVIAGHGLVFNPGEYVEGITNFLWTLLMVPFEALGWDLFLVSEVLGLALSAGLVLYGVRLTSTLTEGAAPARWLAILWGGIWLGTSSSLGLWSHSGMEQALAMFLPLLAAWLLWRDPDGPSRKAALWSGIFMGLGCATRPEIHAIGFCLGLPLVIDVIRHRKLTATTVMWFSGLLLVTVPFHAFRLAYYGSLVPNTFYVKTGDSSMVWLEGLKKLHEMFGFNATGVLVVLAPFAFLTRHRLTEKVVALAITTGFMVFLAKVGVDEMHWHRLYLPALPFLVLLAAVGLVNLCTSLARALPIGNARITPWVVGWLIVATAAITNFAFTYKEMGGFNGRGDLSGNYHPDMGKFLTRHDRPGALAAFQDMGSTPYYAPDIDFLDFIGLVDQTVARARYSYGLHAFMTTESSKNQPTFDAEMRDYFYRRSPEWTILTTYIPGGATADDVARRFAADPHPRQLGTYLRNNGYQFGIVDAKFEANYVHVRTWPRSATYYLSLYRRKDLWDKTPGEVVLDAAPQNLLGAKAMFADGLELIGSEIETSTLQRYEAMMTTWWRVPGPLPADTWFFVHVENDKRRVPYDSLPGDFMYPADRWKPGQIIEHRTLFQVPPDLATGTYRVMAGVYRKGTGERLAITSGPNDGQNRVSLGDLTIERLNPPFHSLIKPTVVDEQRKYPDRIIDHGRHGRRRPE